MKTQNLIGFESAKAAQIAAYFASRSDGVISKMKLTKLIYLAEREFLTKFGDSMLYDEMFSLPHGPVCSNALNGLNGTLDTRIWDQFIKREGRDKILTKMSSDRDNYDEISDAEWNILNLIWEGFGWMSASQIRNYTHKHCPEYTEISEGRIPISFYDIFQAICAENPLQLSKEIESYRKTRAILSA